MFLLQAPQIRELSVFTELPARFRKQGVQTAWADANRGGESVHSFLEGPVFDAAGNLWVCDIPYGRVFSISPQGDWQLAAEYDGEPNGMKFLDAQTLLITDYKNGLLQLNTQTGQVKPYLTRRNTEGFKGVNDLCIARNGDVYFTDQGQTGLHDPTGRVYRYRPATQQLDLLIHNAPSPNGIVLSADEKILYVACTRGNSVWRGVLQPDGSVSKVGQFFTSYGSSGPDGLALDAQGNLLIANPGLGYVWQLNARAEPVAVYHAPKAAGKLANISLTNLAVKPTARHLDDTSQDVYCTDSNHGRILFGQLVKDL